MNTINLVEIRSIKDILKIYEEYLLLDKTQKVIFDFSNAKFIYSNFTAFLNALIDGCEYFEIIEPMKEKVKTVLSKNNFLPTYIDLPKLNDAAQPVIEFEKFALNNLDSQNIFFEKLLKENISRIQPISAI